MDTNPRELEQASKPATGVQFEIFDLILFTTGIAIAIGLNGWRPASQLRNLPVLGIVSVAITSLILGSFFLLMRRILSAQASGLLRQPGCILMLQIGTVATLFTTSHSVIQWFNEESLITIDRPLSHHAIAFVFSHILTRGVAVLVLIFGMYFLPFRWRIFLALLMISHVMQGSQIAVLLLWEPPLTYWLLDAALIIASVLIGLVFLSCVIIDYRKENAYSWWHWIGTAFFVLVHFVLPISQSILARYFSIDQLYGS